MGDRMAKFNRRRIAETARILPVNSAASIVGSAKGQAFVEFGMIVIFFLLLCFAVMEFGWLMFAQMNVQQAVDDGGRYASTGQEGSSGQRVANIVSFIQNEISVPNVNVAQSIIICSLANGAPAGTAPTCYNGSPSSSPTGSGAAGGPSATVTISLVTPLTLMTPLLSKFFSGGNYTFTSSTTFKNESFSPSTTD